MKKQTSEIKIDDEGNESWFNKMGQLHREDGSAYIDSDGNKVWFFNGKIHREDGPAFEGFEGLKEWWFNDKYIDCDSQEEFERIIDLLAFK